MRLTSGRMAARLSVFVLALPMAAFAAPPDAHERALRQDQLIQALKDEAIELSREAQAIESAALVPEHQRVSVYLNVAVRGLLLSQVSIAIDNRPADVHHYDERDARALLAEHSLQRVLRTAVGPGAHRIRVDYKGRYADAKDDAEPVTGSYEAIFDKDHHEAELEFTIARASRFGGDTRMSMKQWRARR